MGYNDGRIWWRCDIGMLWYDIGMVRYDEDVILKNYPEIVLD